MVPIDFHSIFSILWKPKRVHQLFGYQHSSKYILLCSTAERSYTGFEQNEGEKIMTEFSFLGELSL